MRAADKLARCNICVRSVVRVRNRSHGVNLRGARLKMREGDGPAFSVPTHELCAIGTIDQAHQSGASIDKIASSCPRLRVRQAGRFRPSFRDGRNERPRRRLRRDRLVGVSPHHHVGCAEQVGNFCCTASHALRGGRVGPVFGCSATSAAQPVEASREPCAGDAIEIEAAYDLAEAACGGPDVEFAQPTNSSAQSVLMERAGLRAPSRLACRSYAAGEKVRSR